MDAPTFDLQLDKLTEAVVYLVSGSQNDPNFGETKLVKLLYYADCAAYLQTGEPITGATYLRYPHGPYPQAWAARKNAMTLAGDVDIFSEELGADAHKHRWIANRPVHAEVLSSQDETILNQQLERFAKFDATQIVDYAQQEFGWMLTEPGGAIPYDLAGLSDVPLTDKNLETAKRIAANAASRRTAV